VDNAQQQPPFTLKGRCPTLASDGKGCGGYGAAMITTGEVGGPLGLPLDLHMSATSMGTSCQRASW